MYMYIYIFWYMYINGRRKYRASPPNASALGEETPNRDGHRASSIFAAERFFLSGVGFRVVLFKKGV